MSKVYITVEGKLGEPIPEIIEELKNFSRKVGVNVKCTMNQVVYFVHPDGLIRETSEFRENPS